MNVNSLTSGVGNGAVTAQCAREERVKAVRRDSEHLASTVKAHPASQCWKRLLCSNSRNKPPTLQLLHVILLQVWMLLTTPCLKCRNKHTDSTALCAETRVAEALPLSYHPAAAQDTAITERFPGQLAHELGYTEPLSLLSEGWQKRTST